MGKFNGKVAVVTGSSRGIGAQIVRQLSENGAKVVVNYNGSQEAAEKLVAEIEARGGEAIAVKGNVSETAGAQAVIDGAVAKFGHIDVLVNNAGVAEFAPIENVDEAHFDRQFDINVRGTLLTTKSALPHFPQADGVIINLSSVVGDVPLANAAVYSATKSAIDAVTKSLSKELGAKKIRVNAVAPGPVETDMYEAARGFEEYFLSRTPLGRIGQTTDIANAVVFLASDEASLITGQVLGVDGGMIP